MRFVYLESCILFRFFRILHRSKDGTLKRQKMDERNSKPWTDRRSRLTAQTSLILTPVSDVRLTFAHCNVMFAGPAFRLTSATAMAPPFKTPAHTWNKKSNNCCQDWMLNPSFFGHDSLIRTVESRFAHCNVTFARHVFQ